MYSCTIIIIIIITACSASEFLCEYEDACIAADRKCDGVSDCQAGTDERDCGGETDSIKAPMSLTEGSVTLDQFFPGFHSGASIAAHLFSHHILISIRVSWKTEKNFVIKHYSFGRRTVQC